MPRGCATPLEPLSDLDIIAAVDVGSMLAWELPPESPPGQAERLDLKRCIERVMSLVPELNPVLTRTRQGPAALAKMCRSLELGLLALADPCAPQDSLSQARREIRRTLLFCHQVSRATGRERLSPPATRAA